MVADANGVVRKKTFKREEIFDTGGFLPQDKWIYGPDMPNNVRITIKVDPTKDPLAAYDASTGIYTIPEDGLYEVRGVMRVFLEYPKGEARPAFTGEYGYITFHLSSSPLISAGTVMNIYKGSYIPDDQGWPASTYFVLRANGTTWLKKGEQVYLNFLTFGQMIDNPQRIFVDYGKLTINRLF